MSLFNDIGSAVGLGRQRTGSPALPGQDDPTAATTRALTPASTFASTFRSGIGTVLADASRGAYDDTSVRVQLDAFESRLRERAALGAREGRRSTTGGGAPVPGGALAVPLPQAREAQAEAGASPAPSAALPADFSMTRAEQRQLLDLQRQQAHGRAAKVSSSVRTRFSAGFAEPAVARADVRTFRPQTETEAKAFAERLVVEMTESAARLEAVSTDLELARHDASAGKPGSAQDVARLEHEHALLERYVIDVARVVDEQSDDSVSQSSGADQTGSIAKVAGEAVRNGIGRADLERLTKAMSLAQDEARTGNSKQLNNVQSMLRQELVSAMLRQQAVRDRNRAANERREYENKCADRRGLERHVRRTQELAASAQRASQRNAELVALYQRSASERRAAQQT